MEEQASKNNMNEFVNIAKEIFKLLTSEILALVANGMAKLFEKAQKLKYSADEISCDLADTKFLNTISWDDVYAATVSAEDFTSSIEELTDWGKKAEGKIERAKEDFTKGNFKALKSQIEILKTQVSQVTKCLHEFQRKADKAKQNTYKAAKNLETKLLEAKQSKWQVDAAGLGTVLVAVGSIVDLLFTGWLPLVGDIVAAVAAGACTTYIYYTSASMTDTVRRLTKFGEELDDLSKTTWSVLAYVTKLESHLNKTVRSVEVAETAYEYASQNNIGDVVDAVKRIRETSTALKAQVSPAVTKLKKIEEDMESRMHGSEQKLETKKKA
ncbi:uncharacterized protein LOC134197164 [Corticium candelabrum]|uniref:uncharacterized protein LOC134197164 n=1 Tax=Corticium candelabrum TaxID=121492 RepID=UPI002E263400|nr:uncharacterized protein LOC134197164 [Corticium candelabrum]